jgi:hypothetical protein
LPCLCGLLNQCGITNQQKNSKLRLRLSIANTGSDSYDSDWNYFIYTENTNGLNDEFIPASADHREFFVMAESPYINSSD